MIPLVTFPQAQALPSAVQASAAAAAPAHADIVARLPVYAVPSAASALAVPQQQARAGGGVARASPLAEADAAPEPGFADALFAPGTQAPPARLSTPFIAQLLAQAASPGEADALAALYAESPSPASTLNAGLMEAFALVKYKPSYAAFPPPEPMHAAAAPSPAREAGAAARAVVPSSPPTTEAPPSPVGGGLGRGHGEVAPIALPAPHPTSPLRGEESVHHIGMTERNSLGAAAYRAAFTRDQTSVETHDGGYAHKAAESALQLAM